MPRFVPYTPATSSFTSVALARARVAAGLLVVVAACAGDDAPSRLTLPGDSFYPESVTATADGRLFVGSFGTGEVVTFAPGATTATLFIGASPEVPRALGLAADPGVGALWMCANDTAAQDSAAPRLRRYDLVSGELRRSYSFPAPAFCNDIALDGQHGVYVTDSLGAVYRMRAGADHLDPWTRDPLIAPAAPGGFGANGVAWDGSHSLYVTAFDTDRLVRFAIQADGSAAPGEEVAVTPSLSGPDALRALDEHDLLIVEQTGARLTRVTLPDGHATALASGLAQPTSVIAHGATAWVSEGQLGHILGTVAGPPSLPFDLRRVELP
jgi:streptogramin lyase